ncbi:MAG: hypothetical protein ACOYL4_03470 [Miltoncostaeaceae bacterium]
MTLGGIAVAGAVGGCGATTVAGGVALALAALGQAPTVIGIDGHGGGPHVLWGVPVARTVGDLWSVRDELDAAHVAHIVHAHTDALRLVSGPPTAAAMAAWNEQQTGRLAAALVSATPWVADVGRGDADMQRALIAHASVLVVVTSRSVIGASACGAVIQSHRGMRVVVVASALPGRPGVSPRAFRALAPAEVVIGLAEDARGAEDVGACRPPKGRGGMAAAIRDLLEATGA